MVKSSKTHLEEEEDETDVYEEILPRRNSSSSMKLQGRSTHRSKHSETEQRRRSKINERFQVLRSIIPQSDQKRDKASLLLEVIEYIQFLTDKLNMYEASFPLCNQEREATKLMPWRNNHNGPAENYIEQTQVINNGSTPENNVITPGMIAKPQNSLESDFSSSGVFKATDLAAPGSATQMLPLNNVHAQQLNMFTNIARGDMPTQPLQEPPLCDAENNMAYNPQSQLWQGQGRACMTETTAVPSSLLNEQDFTIDNGSYSASSVYSQGIFDTLTQVLQSSGVDLSQASISVQLDVGRRANNEQSAMASISQDCEKQYENNQVMAQTGIRSCNEVSDMTHKRLRTGKS